MLTETQLSGFRRQLEAERTRLRASIHSLAGEAHDLAEFQGIEDSGVGNDPADVGAEVYEQERTLTIERSEQELLGEVEAALARLEAGAYGQCARCGREIAVERLEAIPYAALCISCQSEVERDPRRAARARH
jgi:DnaK suppressor protein